jgi:hypothetical protein
MNTIKDVFAQASACLPTFYATIYTLKIVISQNSKGFASGSNGNTSCLLIAFTLIETEETGS